MIPSIMLIKYHFSYQCCFLERMNPIANEPVPTVPPANQGGMRLGRITHGSEDSFDSSDHDGTDAENYHYVEGSHPLQVC